MCFLFYDHFIIHKFLFSAFLKKIIYFRFIVSLFFTNSGILIRHKMPVISPGLIQLSGNVPLVVLVGLKARKGDYIPGTGQGT